MSWIEIAPFFFFLTNDEFSLFHLSCLGGGGGGVGEMNI